MQTGSADGAQYDMGQALGNAALQIGEHRFEYLPSGTRWGGVTEIEPIGFGEKIGMIIGNPAKHGAINVLQMRGGLREGGDAAIDLNAQGGEVGFQTIHVVVAQGWYRAVFTWTQARRTALRACTMKRSHPA